MLICTCITLTVLIDFTEELYTVCEDDNVRQVCVELLEGESAASIPFNLATDPDTASGKLSLLLNPIDISHLRYSAFTAPNV